MRSRPGAGVVGHRSSFAPISSRVRICRIGRREAIPRCALDDPSEVSRRTRARGALARGAARAGRAAGTDARLHEASAADAVSGRRAFRLGASPPISPPCTTNPRGATIASTVARLPARAARVIVVTRGQLDYEWRHLKAKLAGRDREWLTTVNRITNPEPHPLFRVVPGPVEPWERYRR